MNEQEKRNVWLSFAAAAIAGRKGSLTKILDEAVEIADEMLDEYTEKFEGPQEPEVEVEDDEEEERPPRRRRR